MKIGIVGGGPSGLYLSLLLRKYQPDWDVLVLEQNSPDATFGFGVVMADSGLRNLRLADVDSYDSLIEKMTFNSKQVITYNDILIEIKRPDKGGAIRRIDLLHVLQEEAIRAGVQLKSGSRLQNMSDLSMYELDDADVIVGADGINSIVRQSDEVGFGTEYAQLNNRFAWFGVGKAFPNPALVFRQYDGGTFIAHYYPYTEKMSTFVAECDAATWERFNIENMSDDESRALFEHVFASELDGHKLLSNHSVWRQFPVIRNRHWHSGNKVLIGDALTSAHFSIGSGTRVAMEDAIALAKALTQGQGSVEERLVFFERERCPQKDKLISASERSYMWYEEIGTWMQCYSPHEFVYRFMTRTGRVSDERLASTFPELYAELKAAGVMPANMVY